MSRRTIALVAAIVLAAVATVALISYVQSRGNSKEVQKTLVAVFVAKDVIPQGTSGDTAISQGLITQIKVPQLARVDGAIGSLQEIKGEVAAVDIQKNPKSSLTNPLHISEFEHSVAMPLLSLAARNNTADPIPGGMAKLAALK